MSPRFGWSDLVLGRQSDERLLALAAEGNGRAFATLIERHRRLMLAHAGRIAGHERREDVLQLALLRAWSALCAGVEVHQPQAWLQQIVRNVALTEVGRQQTSATLPEELEAGQPTATSAEQRMEARELLRNLSALPEGQRVALIGTEFGGLTRRQIAADLGTSEGAVRQLVHRARTNVRAAMTGILPAPVVIWLHRWLRMGGTTGSSDGTGVGVAGMSAVSATGALAGGLAKMCTVLLAAGAIGGGLAWHESEFQPRAAVAAGFAAFPGPFSGLRNSSVLTAALRGFNVSGLRVVGSAQSLSGSKTPVPGALTAAGSGIIVPAASGATPSTAAQGPGSQAGSPLPTPTVPPAAQQPIASKPSGGDSTSTTTATTTTNSGTAAQAAATPPSTSTTATDTTPSSGFGSGSGAASTPPAAPPQYFPGGCPGCDGPDNSNPPAAP